MVNNLDFKDVAKEAKKRLISNEYEGKKEKVNYELRINALYEKYC